MSPVGRRTSGPRESEQHANHSFFAGDASVVGAGRGGAKAVGSDGVDRLDRGVGGRHQPPELGLGVHRRLLGASRMSRGQLLRAGAGRGQDVELNAEVLAMAAAKRGSVLLRLTTELLLARDALGRRMKRDTWG